MSQPIVNELTRRRLIQVLGLSGAGLAAAACAGPGGSDSAENEPAPAPSTSGPVEGEVSFAHWRAEDTEVFDTLIAEFTAANPGVTVTQDISPSNDYQSTALQQIRSGNIGDAFVAFRGAQFTDMVGAGLYSSLEETEYVGNYNADLISSGMVDDVQQGLPYQLVFNMPVINTDAFEQAGITEMPADWESFLAACESLLAAGLVPISWPGGDEGNAGHLFNSMVMNNAPSDDMCTLLESGEYKCTDEWFVKTLQQYAELRPYFQPSSTGTLVEPSQQIFASGGAGMLATGSFHIAAVRALGATFPMDLLSPVTVPAADAKYEGIYNATFVLGVNTASDNQAAANAWLEFLSQPENAGAYANGTAQFVTVEGVTYDDPDLQAIEPWLERNTLLAPRFQFNDLDIRSAIESSCIKVVGGTEPEAAAAEAQNIVDQRLSR